MIRIGIFGYGNLGRGVESAIRQNSDMELAAVFTRRAPESVKLKTAGVPVYHADKAAEMADKILRLFYGQIHVIYRTYLTPFTLYLFTAEADLKEVGVKEHYALRTDYPTLFTRERIK